MEKRLIIMIGILGIVSFLSNVSQVIAMLSLLNLPFLFKVMWLIISFTSIYNQ